jgi:hypothetical protein
MHRFVISSLLLLAFLSPVQAQTLAAPDLAKPAVKPDAVQVERSLKAYFFDASRQGNTAMLQEFIDSGYSLDTRTEQGYSALILAAYNGRPAAVDLLMKAGANPCAKDDRGNSALTGAIFKGELSIAKTLLGANCQVDQTNNAGQTAAMYASLFNRSEILLQLQNKGADMNAADSAGNTPNSLAANKR